ncbi:MAG TPA: hypothetical protein ENI80_09900 [Acidiferrobacteraceae bacterium]|nr:hypothetical protein [Acidiferrobacteraceae bacterium]
MKTLVMQFVMICFFRTDPQDLPASRVLLVLTAFAVLFTSIRSTAGLPNVLLMAGVHVFLMGLFIYATLVFRRRTARWQQTASAIFGATATLNLITWPFIPWMERTKDTPQGAIPALIGVFLTIWYISILAHILRHALDIQSTTSIWVSIGCVSVLMMATLISASLTTA